MALSIQNLPAGTYYVTVFVAVVATCIGSGNAGAVAEIVPANGGGVVYVSAGIHNQAGSGGG